MSCRTKRRVEICKKIISTNRWSTIRCTLAAGHCGECCAKWESIGRRRASENEERPLRGVFGEIADARRRVQGRDGETMSMFGATWRFEL
jgi:hypothetical protein